MLTLLGRVRIIGTIYTDPAYQLAAHYGLLILESLCLGKIEHFSEYTS